MTRRNILKIAECEKDSGLPSLDDYNVWHVVSSNYLDCVRDLAAVSSTCRTLRKLVRDQECAWVGCCNRWWQDRHAEEPMVHGWPHYLRSVFKLSSMRSVCQALHGLKSLDLGLWSNKSAAPYGEVLVVTVEGNQIVARELDLGSPSYVDETSSPLLTVSFREGPYHVLVDTAIRASETNGHYSSHVESAIVTSEAPAGDVLLVSSSSSPEKDVLCRQPSDGLAVVSGWTKGRNFNPKVTHRHRLHLEKVSMTHTCPTSGVGQVLCKTAQLMRRVEGLWWAPYGKDGSRQIVQVSLVHSEAYGWPVGGGGLNIIGTKVTGDINVPAGKVSFVVDALSESSIEEVLSDNRPVLGIDESGESTVVSLHQRQIDRCMKCWGQINLNPDVWDPMWLAGSFLSYIDSETTGRTTRFSVLWRDCKGPCTYLMDFWPLDAKVTWGDVLCRANE